jgi:hypothetical protein
MFSVRATHVLEDLPFRAEYDPERTWATWPTGPTSHGLVYWLALGLSRLVATYVPLTIRRDHLT